MSGFKFSQKMVVSKEKKKKTKQSSGSSFERQKLDDPMISNELNIVKHDGKIEGNCGHPGEGGGGTGYVSPAAPKGDGFCVVLV